jgi:Trm5-related predicted tRNA methylase
VSFESLEKEEKTALILVLLKQLQPYLSDVNLNVATESESIERFLGKVNVQRQSVGESKEIKKSQQLDSPTVLPCLLFLLSLSNSQPKV